MSNKKSKRFFAIREGVNSQDRVSIEKAIDRLDRNRHFGRPGHVRGARRRAAIQRQQIEGYGRPVVVIAA